MVRNLKIKYYIICVEQGIAWTVSKQDLCTKKGVQRTIYAYNSLESAIKRMVELAESEKRIWKRMTDDELTELFQPNHYFIHKTKI